jgi:hypothetical protein
MDQIPNTSCLSLLLALTGFIRKGNARPLSMPFPKVLSEPSHSLPFDFSWNGKRQNTLC